MSATTLLHHPIAAAARRLSAGDRLGVALLIAAIIHVAIIVGIQFRPDLFKPKLPDSEALEITLVHSHNAKAPKKADYLAQSNQEGGGDHPDKVRPSSPLPEQRPTEDRGSAARTETRSSPPPPAPPAVQAKPLAVRSPQPRKVQAPKPQPQAPSPKTHIPAVALIERSMEIARLSAEVRQFPQTYAQQPRHKFVTANTKEYVSAAYEEGWRMKVERLGNLNYPDAAKRRNLAGALILEVVIRANGALQEVKVLRSSGEPVLDQAAQRIVRLAAPYARFPPELRKDTDVLHIIRTWVFQGDNHFSTR